MKQNAKSDSLTWISQIALLAWALGASATGAWAAPTNDAFANAIELTGTFDNASGTTVQATRQSGESSLSGYSTTWFRWVAPEAGRARFSVLPTDNDFEDSRISLWLGGSLASLKFLGAHNEYQGEGAIPAFPVMRGQVYHICVGHRTDSSSDQGTYDCGVVLDTSSDLSGRNVIAASASNGTFSSASVVVGNNVTAISYAYEFPAREANEPPHNPSYSSWWKWTAPDDGSISLSLAGSSLGPYFFQHRTFAVYRADSFVEMSNSDWIAGSRVSGGLPFDLTIPVRKGETYYAVAGVGAYDFSNSRLIGGDSPSELPWRVFTLTYSPPAPKITIVSPGRKVGRAFVAVARISDAPHAAGVRWSVTGSSHYDSTNGSGYVFSKRYRAKGKKGRRLSRVSVSAAVYGTDGRVEDTSSRALLSKFRRFK